MKCKVCNKNTPGNFVFCRECNQAKNDGKIIKCEKCGVWHFTDKSCDCKKEAPAKVEKQETEKKFFQKDNSYTKKAIIKKDDNADTIDIRKKWESTHQCDDGHYVRSYSETLIDNWLYNNNITHAYERRVFMPSQPNEIVLSDFYIKKGNVYIEFWGLTDSEKYADRMKKKIKLYEENGYALINLYEDDIKRLNDKLPPLLYPYIGKI